MTETTPGRQPVQIVEIEQPFCANSFGVAPCTAVASSPDRKCYNTRATCGDVPNFELGEPLKLRFSKGDVASGEILDAGYLIPSLVSVSTSPAKINAAGANPDASGLGNRALVNVAFQDHQHTDRIVDPYLSDRTWDPLDADRGTFWTRWIARNKHRQNAVINIYEGYAGQTLAEMRKRTYFVQSVTPPTAGGRVQIQGKDIMTKLEERKSQAPLASPGLLFEDIDETATSLTIAGGLIADYPIEQFVGTVRIGDEVITFTSRSITENGLVISGLTRGADNTTAQAHSSGDTVQRCRRYVDRGIAFVLLDLLANWGGIPLKHLDYAGWLAEVTDYLGLYRITTLITSPTAVVDLISELQISCRFYLWWDDRDAKIKMKAIRGVDVEPLTITAENHIIADSFSIQEQPRERISQIWFHFGQINPTRDLEDEANYRVFIRANLASETPEEHGEPSIRKIYSRWLVSEALASSTASAIMVRYVDVPRQAKFRLDAKDRANWVTDSFYISHPTDVDQFGNRRLQQWTVISAHEVVPGEIVEYLCQDTTLNGQIYRVMADGSVDYNDLTAPPAFGATYIGNSNGFLSDGTKSGRIS